MRTAVYAGSFDPITFGHEDILKKARDAFDVVYIAVGNNPAKKHLFTLEERMDMILHSRMVDEDSPVRSFDRSLARFCRDFDCNYIVRGLRSVTDYEYEIQLAAVNKRCAPDVNTIFFIPDSANLYVSSSVVKEMFKLDEDVSGYASDYVLKQLRTKFNSIEK